jgi:hypothetical protein
MKAIVFKWRRCTAEVVRAAIMTTSEWEAAHAHSPLRSCPLNATVY